MFGSFGVEYAVEEGLLKDTADFYENKHTNPDLLTCNFTSMSENEFYSAISDANEILLDNYQDRVKRRIKEDLDQLYIGQDASFRGFRQT